MITQTIATAQPSDYRSSRSWGDRYMPAVQEIVGRHLFTLAPFDEDVTAATDLVPVRFGLEHMNIAVRVRGAKYLTYAREVTFREARKSGARCELEKVLDGCVDFGVYGFAHPSRPGRLAAFTVLDLHLFRAWFLGQWRRKGEKPGRVIWNADGLSAMRVLDTRILPPNAIIAQRLPDAVQQAAA